MTTTRHLIGEDDLVWTFACSTAGCTNRIDEPKRVGTPVDYFDLSKGVAWADATPEPGPVYCPACGLGHQV